MKECDNITRKIHINSNFILSISYLIMFDTLLLRPSLHCNTPLHFTLHPTTLHYTSPHFTTLIDTLLSLIYTSLPSHLRSLEGDMKESRSVEFISVAAVRYAACAALMYSSSENSNASYARFLKTSFSL
jgi:hypothetical protein